MTEDERLRQKYIRVLPHLNERQRRLVSAADAQLLGYGGIARVARASGLDRSTLYRDVPSQRAALTGVAFEFDGRGTKPILTTGSTSTTLTPGSRFVASETTSTASLGSPAGAYDARIN